MPVVSISGITHQPSGNRARRVIQVTRQYLYPLTQKLMEQLRLQAISSIERLLRQLIFDQQRILVITTNIFINISNPFVPRLCVACGNFTIAFKSVFILKD